LILKKFKSLLCCGAQTFRFRKLFLNEIKDRFERCTSFEDIKSEEDKDKILTAKVRKLVRDYAIDVTPLITEKILYYTRRDFIKFGKIDALMHDERIEMSLQTVLIFYLPLSQRNIQIWLQMWFLLRMNSILM